MYEAPGSILPQQEDKRDATIQILQSILLPVDVSACSALLVTRSCTIRALGFPLRNEAQIGGVAPQTYVEMRVARVFQRLFATTRDRCGRRNGILSLRVVPEAHSDGSSSSPWRQSATWSAASQGRSRAVASSDGDAEPEIVLQQRCPGCGVKMQQDDPDRPGYYVRPKRKEEDVLEQTNELSSMVQGMQSETDTSIDSKEGLEADETLVCARCYSLQHYGRVKSMIAESELPGFDMERIVGNRIAREKGRRAVICCVVDAADFDGSLPRESLQALLATANVLDSSTGSLTKEGRSATHVVLVVNKADLLPEQCSAARLEGWFRRRCKMARVPYLSCVFLVSARFGVGVDMLLESLDELCGRLGDVWVIGAQNAGKSSLINAMQNLVDPNSSKKRRHLTEAAIPGTTLGILQLSGILPVSRCRVYDTPGVLHTHQMTSLMETSEVRMLLPRRQLKPRTFRCLVGSSISIGAAARIDVISAPSSSIYLTLWASDEIACHMGKTSKASEVWMKHAGSLLVPPLGDDMRFDELPELVPRELVLEGNSWKESTVDVAIAGLGWVAVAVGGECTLQTWTFPGVGITLREAMIPDMARDLERPGFTKQVVRKGTKTKKK